MQPMALSELLASAGVLANWAGADAAVLRVRTDSRQVGNGDLFVACQGGRAHGIAFAAQVEQAGAAAIVTDRALDHGQMCSIPVVFVGDARAVAGRLAAARLGFPSRRIAVLGVTGTNGKTTTTILTAQLLTACGFKAAAIGTTGIWTAAGMRPSKLTTPEAVDLQELLAQLAAEGFTHAALEVSSHALDQHRVAGVEFAAAAWTNLSHDHLDYHGTLPAYAAAKARLFSDFGLAAGKCFVNGDDEFAADVWHKGRAEAFSLGAHPAAEHHVTDLAVERGGIRGVLRSRNWSELRFAAPLLGRHNAENLAAALLLARAAGAEDAALTEACRILRAPRGRLQTVANDLGALIAVDYAHSPDALAKVLGALRPLVGRGGRLLAVFGCGGDRDAAKRAEMGKIAGQLADLTVVTSDNPRSEQPQAIADAIAAGLATTRARKVASVADFKSSADSALYSVCVDRGQAIAAAVAVLRAGDVLCIAGKGHETTQIIGANVLEFDDIAHVEAALTLPHLRAQAQDHAEFSFDAWQALAATGGRLAGGGAARTGELCTDTRKLADKCLFVALPGERFDGALFIGEALGKGAAGIVCAQGKGGEHTAAAHRSGAWIVEVADPLLALGGLAAAYRNRFDPLALGVTGSNGKTTTKELTALALSPLGAVLATFGNHNNQVGVPLTLARLQPHHRAAVVEMGMSVPGEIALLAAMARPRIGIITSIAEAHLEGMGTVDAIAREKFALIEALPPDGVAILPADEPLLRPLAASLRCRVVWFGRQDGDVTLGSAVQAENLDTAEPRQRFVANVGGARVPVLLPGLGVHLAHNALAALAAAWVAGANLHDAAAALQGYKPVGQRMLPSRIGPWLVLEDCYNANPRSTETALDTLATLPGPRVAVLGEMRELGPNAPQLHARVGGHAARACDWLIAVGAPAEHYAAGAKNGGLDAARIVCCDSTQQAAQWLLRHAPRPATLLVKGSRGARMEGVVEGLKADSAAAVSLGGV